MEAKLESILQKVKILCEQNPEFKAELWKTFSQHVAHSDYKMHTVSKLSVSDDYISEIYEYCIEKIIKQQAEQFYEDFPIPEIRDTLIRDFCRMERFRRQNEMQMFWLAVEEQIECITNSICSNVDFQNFVCANWDKGALIMYDKNTKSKYRALDFTIAQWVFDGKKNPQNSKEERKLKEWKDFYITEKICILIYFLGYRGSIDSQESRIAYEKRNLLYKLCQGRNEVHRGGTKTDYQEDVLKELMNNSSKYYLIFEAQLAEFVDWIKRAYPLTEDYIKKIEEYV